MADNKDMTGALFLNDKGDNPKRPDYKGRVVIEGKEWQLSVWKRTSKAGLDYLSVAVDAPKAASEPKKEDGDLPF